MTRIPLELARQLIDFAPEERLRRAGFGESQLEGTVAAWNMLETHRVAYLADEVGMGKTYVALGVLGLLRHLQPSARVLIVAPRENIQRKWVKEQRNFVRNNWLVDDARVRDLAGGPVRRPVVMGSLPEFAHSLLVSPGIDPVLRMTSFSIWASDEDARRKLRKRLLPSFPWAGRRLLPLGDEARFRDNVGRLLNTALPPIDLLIVDEGHNLKHGFGLRSSIRNRVLGLMLGHRDGADPAFPTYGPRVRRLLVLSATPFEQDWSDLWRQLDVLGFGHGDVADAAGGGTRGLEELRDRDRPDCSKKALARRFVIRRVAHLRIGGEPHSKNMYRREWRMGGFGDHDQPIELTDPKQRLTVALVQKKVLEVLGDRRFGNAYQIGMLSSFESFLESLERREQKDRANDPDLEADSDSRELPVFDGDQEATHEERDGADRATVAGLVRSYRERFGHGLPHPKLDATTAALAAAFTTGDKSLVFVRRVATVAELTAKLNRVHDARLRRRMITELPDLEGEIRSLFRRYESERLTDATDSGRFTDGDDEGGRDSFFSWFFRGAGPDGVLSGAAFQKNRLASMSSTEATLFEDDHVARLLGHPPDPLVELGRRAGLDRDDLADRLRPVAWAFYRARTTQHTKLKRLLVFEAWQVAGLHLLVDLGGVTAERAQIVLHLRYESSGLRPDDQVPPAALGRPASSIGIQSLPVLLSQHPTLGPELLPDEPEPDFAEAFRKRELRRELLSGMCRLGAAFIDLYLLAIHRRGSFDLGRDEGEVPTRSLAEDFVDRLAEQRETPGFHAHRELSQAARNFDLLAAVNFPDLHDAPLSSAAQIFGRTLQRQQPVGGMAGGVNKRLVRQFRMPGYPLVLASTDVLQEGEDLHTFCKNVIHYGITWTPSAMEQRTGRIDRIGGLVQRNLDGRDRRPEAEELIQVHFPHLRDTIEVLQVRRVLERLNRFIEMAHEQTDKPKTTETRIDLTRELVRRVDEVPRIEGLLESAFPVRPEWLTGELDVDAITAIDTGALEDHLEEHWRHVVDQLHVTEIATGSRRRRAGIVTIDGGRIVTRSRASRHQPFELTLRSRSECGSILVRCTSPIGIVDLTDSRTVDRLARLQQAHRGTRLCARPGRRGHDSTVTIETDRLFALETSQAGELADLIERTVLAADGIEEDLLDVDAGAERWLEDDQERDHDE